MEEFENIQPYNDEEAVAALQKLARHPAVLVISKYIFPELPINTLKKMLLDVKGVDDFQHQIVSKAVSVVVGRSSSGFTYEGVENLKGIGGTGKYLAVSNHRDIVLDPALTQWMLLQNNLPLTEICVGNNLLANGVVETLLRSNRMITVIRGISAREVYLSSQILSKFIRSEITSGKSSVWIAQREGRTKNGLDVTEQGLLKMFDMSGEGDFKSNFEELNIVPMSISYEYEPCAFRKAREILIKQMTGEYHKKEDEDMHSILTGIRQWKGGIHLCVGEPLTAKEIEHASWYDKNDRYQAIRRILDERIISGYKLWKTNYMGYDLMNGTSKYADKYTQEDLEKFKEYTEHKLKRTDKKLDKNALRDIFWHIYGNPVAAKED
ncbi:MAG: 1-acyl-sn-glycerol-3-phosphate acyltransferase [Bacteroidales bacterium]|nr:1-acyl-sn-glycerol-3-phosphate acyltransferase [Bacteroidales bacterium]